MCANVWVQNVWSLYNYFPCVLWNLHPYILHTYTGKMLRPDEFWESPSTYIKSLKQWITNQLTQRKTLFIIQSRPVGFGSNLYQGLECFDVVVSVQCESCSNLPWIKTVFWNCQRRQILDAAIHCVIRVRAQTNLTQRKFNNCCIWICRIEIPRILRRKWGSGVRSSCTLRSLIG